MRNEYDEAPLLKSFLFGASGDEENSEIEAPDPGTGTGGHTGDGEWDD